LQTVITGHIRFTGPGAIEIHCNRAVYVSLNTNPNPNPNPKLSPSPNPNRK